MGWGWGGGVVPFQTPRAHLVLKDVYQLAQLVHALQLHHEGPQNIVKDPAKRLHDLHQLLPHRRGHPCPGLLLGP